jgi:Family of unknown function (DUF5324)
VTRLADYMDSPGVRAVQDQYQRLAPRAKKTARHAAKAVAPYADTAKDKAVQYSGQAWDWAGPKMASAVDQALDALPPRVEDAVETAAKRTRETVMTAADYTVPRVGQAWDTARSVAEPVAGEAASRSAAAVAALRGQVTPREIDRLIRRRARRARNRRFAKRLTVVGLVAGGGYAVWSWWQRQTNPDWLVEAPAATEVSPDGSGTRPSPGTATGRPGERESEPPA